MKRHYYVEISDEHYNYWSAAFTSAAETEAGLCKKANHALAQKYPLDVIPGCTIHDIGFGTGRGPHGAEYRVDDVKPDFLKK